MQSVLFAEFAVLLDFDTVRIVLLILRGLVVALFALGAGQGNTNTIVVRSHVLTPHLRSKSLKVAYIDYHTRMQMST